MDYHIRAIGSIGDLIGKLSQLGAAIPMTAVEKLYDYYDFSGEDEELYMYEIEEE